MAYISLLSLASLFIAALFSEGYTSCQKKGFKHFPCLPSVSHSCWSYAMLVWVWLDVSSEVQFSLNTEWLFLKTHRHPSFSLNLGTKFNFLIKWCFPKFDGGFVKARVGMERTWMGHIHVFLQAYRPLCVHIYVPICACVWELPSHRRLVLI